MLLKLTPAVEEEDVLITLLVNDNPLRPAAAAIFFLLSLYQQKQRQIRETDSEPTDSKKPESLKNKDRVQEYRIQIVRILIDRIRIDWVQKYRAW